VDLTFATTPPGLEIRLGGVNGVAVTAPATLAYAPGTSVTVYAPSPQSGPAGTRYAFRDWSDGGAQTHTITVPSTAATYTAGFITQYLLTTLASPSGSGTVTPPSGYQNAGNVSVQATPSGCYSFLNWTGGTVTADTVNLVSPTTLQANFILNQRVASTIGSVVTIRGLPPLFRRTVAATNTLPFKTDLSFIVDGYSGATLVNPALPSGQTTECSSDFGSETVGRNFYTVANVDPGRVASVSFDFTAPPSAFNVTVVAGPGRR